ncbi:MAG: 50S ribosomal protein L18 [Neisseriales bacterium]|uniref:Large ribosomal subunit protein uL18 n=1 Tax=Aquella oligotrophica TaxID=2067065 RepID=A0A2I7N8Q6_9NEIS|nr:50S ribosomal protein L18 [Aquella oligotrophica]AUR52840.1 50S ribosomal protein L18 [Aquella oligotrophica]TXI92643.1 MAG: 50S ribosomal protein L18 [Neisseriales bacterium]
MSNKVNRIRRARKTRLKIAELGVKRLVVHKTNCHIYAQIIDETGSKVLAVASTAQKALSGSVKNGGNIEAAKLIGKAIAEKATSAGIKEVAFDRAGFKYHGRIKAVADAARENGLVF